MDFHNMNRKQLQALCKKHNIPANLSNLQLAQNLASLLQEKEKLPAKRGRAGSKALVETVEEKDSGVTTRKSKKVRFSPHNEMFEYVSSGHKGKTKVMLTKSVIKPGAEKRANIDNEKANSVESNEEVMGKAVRSLRSRVQASVEGGVIPVVNLPVEKKRGRKLGKDVDKEELVTEIVSPVRVTRSRMQTSKEGGIIPVPKLLVEKKRGRGVAKDIDIELVEEIVGSSPVKVTRSRAQISVEGGEVLAFKPQDEKKRVRGVVKDADTVKDTDVLVRTRRSRVRTSTEVFAMPSSPVEKKRTRTGMKNVAETVESADAVLDFPVKAVCKEAASDRVENLPLERSMRQKNQKQKAAKDVIKSCEVEPLATDGGVIEQELCLRRSTRNAVKLGVSTVLNRSSDETEMGGRGKKTRSGNHLALKEDSDLKSEMAIVVKRKSEVVLQAGDALGRTGRISNRRKSVLPQVTENGDKVQGVAEMVPKLKETVGRLTRMGSKQISIWPKIDETEAARPMAEKGDVLKENKSVVPPVGPVRRSHCQSLPLESIVPTDQDLPSHVITGKKRPGKQSSKGFKTKLHVKGLKQNSSGKIAASSAVRNNRSMKQKEASNSVEQTIDIKCAPLVEESPIRLTRNATKGERNAAASLSGKVGKKQLHSRTVTPNLVVETRPEEISAIKRQPSQVTKSSSDISGSSQVIKDSSFKIRSEPRRTRSSMQGSEVAKGQGSALKNERFHTDDVKKDREISVRKGRGGFIFKEDVETSPRRFTRSAPKNEKNTEQNLLVKSAGKKKLHSCSITPKLVVDKVFASIGQPILKGSNDLFSACTGVIKEDSSKKSRKSWRSAQSSKLVLHEVHTETCNVEVTKGKVSSSKSGGSTTTYERQKATEVSARKQRGKVAFEELAVDFECAPIAEEFSRRLTRSALKGDRSTTANPTEKSAGKNKRRNRSDTPKLEVKVSSADGNLVVHGLSDLDAQFLSPKVLESATGPARVVSNESSSKKRKKVFSSTPATEQGSTEDVHAQTSHLSKGKSQISFQMSASESEMLQLDDLEKEIVVSVNETVITTDANIMEGQIVPRDESSLEIKASAIELATDIDLSFIQKSSTQFTGTAVMGEPESPNLALKVSSEVGPSALKEAPSIAALAELPEWGDNLVLDRGDILEDSSISGMKKSSTVFQVTEEGGSDEVCAETLSKTEANAMVPRVELSVLDPMRLQDGIDTQMDISVGEEVLVAANLNIPIGLNKDYPASSKLVGQEALEDLSISDDAGFAGTGSDSPTTVKEIDETSTGKIEESLLRARFLGLTKGQNPEIVDNENNVDSAECHESKSSPARKSIELEVSLSEKSLAIDELSLQVPEDFENAMITLLRSSDEPPELGDGMGMASTSSYSEKQKSSVNVFSDEVEGSASVNLEKIEAFNLQELQREQSSELDSALETPSSIVNSTDHHSGFRQTVEHSRKICDATIPGNVCGSNILSVYNGDDIGLEKKMDYASVEDGVAFIQNKLEFVGSPRLDEGYQKEGCESSHGSERNEQKFVESAGANMGVPLDEHDDADRETSEPQSFDRDCKGNLQEMHIAHDKDAVKGVYHVDGTVPVNPVVSTSTIAAISLENENGNSILGSFGVVLEADANSKFLDGNLFNAQFINGEASEGNICMDVSSCHEAGEFQGEHVTDPGLHGSSIKRSEQIIFREEETDRDKHHHNQMDAPESSAKVDDDIPRGLLAPSKDNDESGLGGENREVGDHGFGIQDSPDAVGVEERQREECLSKDNQLPTIGEVITDSGCTECKQDFYHLQHLFKTPASIVRPGSEETSTQVSEMADLVLSKNKSPRSLGNVVTLQGSQSVILDGKSMEEGNSPLATCEDLIYGGLVGDWHEDTLQASIPMAASSSCTSSKNAKPCSNFPFSEKKTHGIGRNETPDNYFESHLENKIETHNPFAPLYVSDFDGDEENIHLDGESNSVEAGRNDVKEAITHEKARNVQEFSDEQLLDKGVSNEDHCDSSIDGQASNKP